ncbi:MAG: type II toxin-antitoxin system RelE/ParE family toxin [Acidimicrobiales bacterium]
MAVVGQAALAGLVEALPKRGPDLGRPAVDRISRSRHHNMKGLRASEGGALRVLFGFDPRRYAILLIGGDKTGRWNEWCEWAIPAADDLYDVYLEELRGKGLVE